MEKIHITFNKDQMTHRDMAAAVETLESIINRWHDAYERGEQEAFFWYVDQQIQYFTTRQMERDAEDA